LSGFLPIQFLLAQGEGLVTKIVPTWRVSPWMVLLAALIAIAFVAYQYYRERGAAGVGWRLLLGLMRLALIGIVIAMLYGWMRHRHKTDLPDLVIAIDDSASMATGDEYPKSDLREAVRKLANEEGLSSPTRIELARALLTTESDGRSLLDELSEHYNIKFYRIGATSRVLSTESPAADLNEFRAVGESSELGNNLRDIIETQRGRPTAAIVVLSDGITTAGRSLAETAEYARRKNTPLFLIGLGNDKPARDLRLTDLLASDVVFVDDTANFDMKLTAEGFEGESVTVKLIREGESAALDQKTVAITEDGVAQKIRLSHRPDTMGEFDYAVVVEPAEGEMNRDNNRETKHVSVRDETIRVLLAGSFPTFEYTYLKRLFSRQVKKSDPTAKSIDLVTVLQSADLDYAKIDETAERLFPVDKETLFEFDVIILCDLDPRPLKQDSMQNIADFVKERGGGVVFIAGEKYLPLKYQDTPLESLLPITLDLAKTPATDQAITSGYRPQPTRLGMTMPQMQFGDSVGQSLDVWRKLPELYWLLETPDLKPAARVLVEHPTRTGGDGRALPVISMHYVGAGKVIFHATDESWRWRFPFNQYWVQTARYLSRSKLLGQSRAAEMTIDREDGEYRRGDPVYLRVRFLNETQAPPEADGVTIMLEREGGRRRSMKLAHDPSTRGVFETTISQLAEGSYRAWVAAPTLEGKPPARNFIVVAPPGEQARIEMDTADLKQAAKISRGEFYTLDTVDDLLDDLPEGRQVRIETMPPETVWNAPWFALAFIVIIIGEWLLRKRLGML